MRYAILGDIHANLAALDAVLEAVDGMHVDRVLQVGDVVGYGADPSASIARLRERKVLVVKGNHDAACVGEIDARTFNPSARAAVLYTISRLSRDELRWLADLPLTASDEHCTLSHGTLDQPERYEYIQCTEDADASLDILERPVCFVGHTHVPVSIMRLIEAPNRTSYTVDRRVDLTEAKSALVNVGSVGQPRDEDCRAAYAIYDSESHVVDIHRVDYDIETAAAKILRAGLPKLLADRLFLGI